MKPELIQRLVDCLAWYVMTDEVNEWDAEVNEPWIEGKYRAVEVIAQAEKEFGITPAKDIEYDKPERI